MLMKPPQPKQGRSNLEDNTGKKGELCSPYPEIPHQKKKASISKHYSKGKQHAKPPPAHDARTYKSNWEKKYLGLTVLVIVCFQVYSENLKFFMLLPHYRKS